MPTVPALQNTGPFVAAATFCEKVLTEASGAVSLIRVTDTINQAVMGSDAPREMQPFMANITLVVMLKSGSAKGQYGLMVRPEAPSGEQMPPFEVTIQLQGDAWGANVVAPMQFPVTMPGVYWFDVLLTEPTTDVPGQFLTRVPLDVVYQRVG
ncbi:MAG TPA: hypothetical protein VL979_09155 [Solirubrobacteraceae bacterium]|nr:hypothetical protein [Solirubrobacteraceae bacterium]